MIDHAERRDDGEGRPMSRSEILSALREHCISGMPQKDDWCVGPYVATAIDRTCIALVHQGGAEQMPAETKNPDFNRALALLATVPLVPCTPLSECPTVPLIECDGCGGDGKSRVDVDCAECDGVGECDHCGEECRFCSGTGVSGEKVSTEKCHDCGGTGKNETMASVSFAGGFLDIRALRRLAKIGAEIVFDREKNHFVFRAGDVIGIQCGMTVRPWVGEISK